MTAIVRKLAGFQNTVETAICQKTPDAIQKYTRFYSLSVDTLQVKIIRILAPIFLASVAAYFCPAAGAAKYVIKAVVLAVAWVISLPVCGIVQSAVLRTNRFVASYLGIENTDSTIKKLVKQLALPLIAGVAVYYFVPSKLVFNLSSRTLLSLATIPYAHIALNQIYGRAPAASTSGGGGGGGGEVDDITDEDDDSSDSAPPSLPKAQPVAIAGSSGGGGASSSSPGSSPNAQPADAAAVPTTENK
jgi:hypothetical protein